MHTKKVIRKSLLLGIALLSFNFITAMPVSAAALNPMDKPCYLEEKVHKITVKELSEKVGNFTEGDPLFYTLLSIFSDTNNGACYYAVGKDLQQVFLNKSIIDLSDLEVIDGKTYYKTRAPVEEISWTSAKITEGNIKVSTRLHTRFVSSVLGKKILEIPKVLDFTISTSNVNETEEGEKKDKYHISITYDKCEEPFFSDIFTLLTGLTSREMPIKKHDRKPNRREAYKALHYLHSKGLINIY